MLRFLPACAEAMATAKAREANRRILEAGDKVGHEVTLKVEDDTRFPTHWEMDDPPPASASFSKGSLLSGLRQRAASLGKREADWRPLEPSALSFRTCQTRKLTLLLLLFSLISCLRFPPFSFEQVEPLL